MIGFLNDYRLALDLKAFSARHPEEAFVFWNNLNEADTPHDKIIKDQFMHVKWHAVHEFYSKLKIGMEKLFGLTVSDIGNEEITAVTHRDSKTRTALGFAYNGKIYYVCNDGKGFSVGVDKLVKETGDYSVLSGTVDYAFFDFSERKVFDLLDPERNDALVDRLLEEFTLFINGTTH